MGVPKSKDTAGRVTFSFQRHGVINAGWQRVWVDGEWELNQKQLSAPTNCPSPSRPGCFLTVFAGDTMDIH